MQTIETKILEGDSKDVLKQLDDNSIGVEIVPEEIEMIKASTQEQEFMLFEAKDVYKTNKT